MGMMEAINCTAPQACKQGHEGVEVVQLAKMLNERRSTLVCIMSIDN